MTQPTRNIGIERYMAIRSAYGPTYSHDNQRLYFLSTISGIPQVWSLDNQTPWPRQLTFFTDRVMHVAASPTKEMLCISADSGGNERAQLYLLDRDGFVLREITQDPDHIYLFGGWSRDGSKIAYSSNRRNPRHFDLYLYDVENDSHQVIHTSNYTNYAVGFSPDGKYVLLSRQYTNMSNDLFLLEVATGQLELLTPHEGEASFRSPRFSPDGKELYLLSDQGSEFVRVAHLDLSTKSWTWLTEDQWDAESITLSRDGRLLAYTKNEDGRSQLYILDVSQEKPQAIKELPSLPRGVIADALWNPAGTSLALTISAPLYGTEVWELKLETKELRRVTYASISGVPQETFIEPELIHYPSFDGLSIPAFYYRPRNVQGPYPVVVYVHGGPESQSRASFNSIMQFFLQQGFAVFVPNVRGSSGYGRTWIHLDDVRKRMDSVADLAKCVDWLVTEGEAKEDAIAVMGGSYGGFMVLAALTHYPDLWAAGVDIVGISNLRTFIENTSPYRRHLRESEYGTIEEDGEFFDQISPIHHIDKITAPLMVIHGANDPRVPISEAEQIVEALRKRNHPVEYLRYDDEGHGIVKLENRIDAYGKIAVFLNKWIKK